MCSRFYLRSSFPLWSTDSNTNLMVVSLCVRFAWYSVSCGLVRAGWIDGVHGLLCWCAIRLSALFLILLVFYRPATLLLRTNII